MSDSVNLNNNNILNDFVSVDKESLQNQVERQSNADAANMLDFEDVAPEGDANGALKGALVIGGAKLVGEELSNAIDELKISKPSNGFWSSVGRFFIRMFSFLNTVKDSSTLDQKQNSLRSMDRELPPLPPLKEEEPEMYSVGDLGKVMGLDRNAHVEPFKPCGNSGDRFKDLLFPHGEPYLSDIKQDPNIQNCWFLSTVGSVLAQKGSEAITRLFSQSEFEGKVTVRLGQYKFDVPAGDIVGSKGERVCSNSANWVRLLETAMQMYNLKLQENLPTLTEGETRMVNRDPSVALKALLCEDTEKVDFNASHQEKLQTITTALNEGKAVVMGHNDSLTDGVWDSVSTNHAVSLLDYMPDQHKFMILDPYGQVKTLSISALVHFALVTT